MILVTVSTIK